MQWTWSPGRVTPSRRQHKLSIRVRTIYVAGRKNREQEAVGERPGIDKRAELARLRQENKELRMEKKIPKKTSAFFAKEMK